MKAALFSLVLLALAGGTSSFGQTILRVNQAASGSTHNGLSWDTAFTKLEDALAAAQPTASQPVEIWVAKGTYKPTTDTNRAAAFQLKSNLTIRGGFRGNEASPAERTPWGNPTVLSGDIGTPMVGAITDLNESPAQPASTDDAGWADNSYNVLVGDGVEGVILEFLTITGGSATSTAIDRADIDGYELYAGVPETTGAKSAVKPSSQVVGGGISFNTGPTWTVARFGLEMYSCTFARNRARGYGGALALYDGSAFFGGCAFDQNVSDGPGGAVWGLNQQSAFVQCGFTKNVSRDGGGAVKIMGIPSERASNADVDGFNDALRGIAFSIYGVADEKATRDKVGSLLTAFGIYKAANKFAATEGGFFTKAASTFPNPFAKGSTQVGGATVTNTNISPGTRLLAAYALVQIGFSVGDNIVKVLDALGKLDKNSADYQRWVAVNEGFNRYATPQGLISLGAHAAINAALPATSPDLIAAKKASYENYTQAGRSGFAACTFTENQADNEGGAIELVFNNLLVENCTFTRNQAGSNGGAISSAMWNMPQVISSVFANNTSTDGTSAIANSFSSIMMVVNCSIVNNKSETSLGKAVSATMGADVRVYNSILWNNANKSVTSGADVEAVTESMLDENARKRYDALQGERVNWLGIMDIRNSIVQSLDTIPLGTDSIAPRLAGANLSQAEINAAVAAMKDADARGELESSGAVNVGAGVRPKLRDPSYGNSAADPLLLSSPTGKISVQSPATNAGKNQWITWKMISHAVAETNIMDVSGQKRVQNSRVDIGAYEVDTAQPDSAPLAGANVEVGAGNAGNTTPSGVGAGTIATTNPAVPRGATVYYVKPTASGNGSGLSWANATSDLGSAISHANAEVWVAAGTYRPTAGSDRSASFSLANGVRVFGGFAGSETTRAARNWKTNVTIISGDIGTPGDASDNSKNLFRNVNATRASSTVLDGFTLRDAYSTDADGGAILNVDSAPLVRNCVFRNNHARNGGAISSSGSNPEGSTLLDCEFRDNSSEAEGGAVSYAQTLFGSNVIFRGNTAGTRGGAIAVTGSVAGQYATIQNGLFTNNAAADGTGGAIASAGLLLNVVNATFYGNTATATSAQKVGGGAIDDGTTAPEDSPAQIFNSIFYKNTVVNLGSGGIQTVEKQQIQSALPLLRNSLVQGLSTFGGRPVNGNFSGDPLFVVEGTDFRLQDTSLAIDAGDSTSLYTQAIPVDLEGGSRLINGAMDLGPYEHGVTAAHPVRTVTKTSVGTESHTFSASYTAEPGDYVRWYVDRGDGLGFVALTESDENRGVFSNTLTVSSRPNGFSYRLQLTKNGTTFFSSVAILEPTAASIARYVYVKPTATGDGSGSSWSNATSDLRSAVGRDNAEVWVAAGTYRPTAGTDRDAAFLLGTSTKVYGGFVGNETQLTARDWRANRTVISGEIGGAGVEDNSRHLFRNTDVGSSSLLDGLFFEDAYAENADGGAILNVRSCPAIQNCVFQTNHARNGGAVASRETSAVGFGSKLFNCEFRGNTAEQGGGALAFDGSWAGANLLFKDNVAATGGAIFSTGDEDGRSATVQNALYVGNRATAGPGGAVWASGMGFYVVNSTFYGNQATLDSASQAAGGAIFFDRAASTMGSLGIYNSIFYKNTALNTGTGGRATTEKQQISLAAANHGGARASLIQGLQTLAGNGNFDGDPFFVQEGTDFHVVSTSATIEAGTMDQISGQLETTDLDGNSRIIGAIDLGPYEHTATAANPIRKITSSSSGLENYSYSATDYSSQTGDTLAWQVDRGDGYGFVALGANDPGDEALPDAYLGMNSASLTVLTPPSGFLFRLRLVRGSTTYYSPAVRLFPTELSRRAYVYVRPVATGDGSGSGWVNATSDLQAALSTPNVQVWVQEGIYYPATGTDRDASFSLTAAGVKVYGGFRGTETLRDARSPKVRLTRISGNIGSPLSAQDNSRHLFRNQNVGPSTILDGLTFEDAYADGEDGGAILNISSSPTIVNCVFRNNHARNGGAIASTGTPGYLFGSDLVGCRFENNTAELAGGAVNYNSSGSIENTVFKGNTAGAGGAISLSGNSDGLSFTVKNGLFLDNRALDGRGGAISSAGISLTVANSTFHGNRATLASASPLGGGAIYQNHTISGASTVQLYNSIFYGNFAVNPGAGGLASLEDQQVAVVGDGAVFADHSLIEGLNRHANIPALGNFDENPGFVDPVNGDFRLLSVSPAINSGVTSGTSGFLLTDPDLDGNLRVRGGAVDLGPYEFTGSAALGRITAGSDFSSGNPRFFRTAGFAVEPGDVLRWYVDRGDGNFVPLVADAVYSGVDSRTLTITAPPAGANGYLFRLQVVRGGVTLTTTSTRFTLPPARLYVDAARLNMSSDGLDWSTAFGSLADALKASGPGTEIWVAGGTYLPTSGANTDAAFQIPVGVKIYGGFLAGGTSISARNPVTRPTILSGKLNGAATRLGYSRHVVVNRGTDRTGLLDGFILEDAYSGLLLNDGASPTIRNCVFRDNDSSRAGDGYGAAIANINGANPLIAECQFLRNTSTYAGALYISGASATVENSVFAGNSASATGGAIFVQQGTLNLTHATLADNTSKGIAAALYAQDSTVTVANCIVWNNRTSYKGFTVYDQAIRSDGGEIVFRSSNVEGGASLPATNMTFDPIFDPTQGGDYALAPYSPLVNAASANETVSSNLDLAGRPRVRESAPDIGAYELATNATGPVRLSSLPRSRVAYNIGGTVDFTVSWPAGSALDPTWALYLGTTPLSASRYTVIAGNGFSTVRLNNLSLLDSGLKVSFTDSSRGVNSIPPAVLTVREPRVVHVNPVATGANDGTSWANAYTSLATALNNAETADEIRVVAGTYTPDTAPNFNLNGSVTLLGGFVGTETARTQRDPAAHLTILHAAGTNPVIFAATPDADSGLSSSVDGFIVENSTGPAAVYCAGVTIAFRNVVLRNNAGYIGNFQSQVEYDNCEFTGNTGSLFFIDRSTVTLAGSLIHNNTTAVDLLSSYNDSTVVFSDTVVNGNTVAGALFRNSAGAAGGSLLTVLRSDFRQNSTGGAVIANGSGSTVRIESSLFAKNTAIGDLATLQNGGTLSITLSTVADNLGGSFGGGVYTYLGSVTSIDTSIFWGNRGTRATSTIEKQQLGDSAGTDGAGTLTVKRSTIEGLATFTAANDLNTAYFPLFVDSSAGDYRLVSYSPAIDDAASNMTLLSATDLDGVARRNVYGAAGAYEFTGTLGTPLLISSYPSSLATTETTATGFTYAGQGNKQWQVFDGTNWVNITANTGDYRIINDGSTTTLYFDSPTPALNGTRYRLVITGFGATFTTGDLVLTVNPPRILYVNGGAPASGDGSSWATAFQTVQQALAVTNENTEIWVQAGTYAINSANLKWNVHLYGGFAGDETARNQRDWTANEVTLFGGGQRIFAASDPATSKTSRAVLDGFTLTGSTSSSAVFLGRSDATIANSTFRGNSCAIGVSGQSNPTITNCIFNSHSFTVLALDGDSADVRGCTFQSNSDTSANASGAIVYVYRGAVEISDSKFVGNTSSGGVVVASGDFDATSAANLVAGKVTQVTLSRCEFTGNTAYAGILATQALVNLDNSLIAQNALTSTAVRGFSKCLFNLTNDTIAHNTGTFENVAIANDGTTNLKNSILWGNRTSWPYGPFLQPGSLSLVEDSQIKRNSSTFISNSIVEGAYAISGNGNSGYDPLFVDPVALNYQLVSVSPAINQGSASGIPSGTLDLASQPRINELLPDIGAYEFPGAAGTPVRVSSNLDSRSVIVGQTTEYSVQVPAGVNVQWQVKTGGSFVDVVSGGNQTLSGNGRVLTLSNVGLPMSGTEFRFVLSGGASYTSASGVLSVVPKPIVHVAAGATGNNDGSSWANAFTSVNAALSTAANPITGGPREIWVAQGTYTTDASISPGVELYGGFAGAETTRSDRSPAAHPTILTNSVAITSATGSDILANGYPDTKKIGIVIDGFTLTGTTGGITVWNGPVLVRNCTFSGLVGYGIKNVNGPLTVEDSTFDASGNVAVIGGPWSTTTIKRSTFQNGTTASSVQSSEESSVTIEDSLFRNNTTSGNLDTVLYVSSGSTVNVTRSRFLKNHAASAIHNDGRFLIRQSLIADNLGAGVDMGSWAEATRLTSVTIANNASWGIGNRYGNTSLRLSNSIIAGNNFRQQIYTDSGGVFASYTLVQGETHGGAGNQEWDPLFVNAAAGDYTLAPRSPGINAGDATAFDAGETDLAGSARIQSGAPDLGAYESASAPNPLYRGTLPASLATTRGVNGVFSLRGSPSYAYTWQYFDGSTWVDITFNATTGQWEGPSGVPLNITTVNGLTTLTIPGPALIANGLQFRVTIDGEGVTSAPLTLTVSEPEIMYVDASVATSGDGKTWSGAFKTFSEALTRVIPSRRIIYVAKGTYKPAATGYEIRQRVEIYGGFPTGGAAFSSRNATVNPVIFSGELGDPASTADNATPVVGFSAINAPIASDTIIDGVTIDGGKTGVLVTGNASPTLRNLILSHNTDSGLEISSAGGRVEFCQFLGNSAYQGAGAVANASTVTFSGCSFRGNTASAGGGLYILNSNIRMENLVISGNKATISGGGIKLGGGYAYLVNSTVVGNSAAEGAGLYVNVGAGMEIRNSILWANRASSGNLEAQQLTHHLFGGYFVAHSSNIEGFTPSGSNLSADPLFYSTIEAANAPTTAGDFHLYGGSSLIDRGDSALLDGLSIDADGAPRSVRAVDMGAYEFQGAAGDPLVITQQPADLALPVESGASQFAVVLGGSGFSYQWESSTNGSTFTPVVDGTNFAGSQTATLRLLTNDPTLNGVFYRAKVTAAVGGVVYSRNALLTVYPSQYYVNAAAADDSGDGYTWATAFKTLGTALSKVRVNPTSGVQVWVAGGTYEPSASDPSVFFPLKSKVALYGGFAGTESALAQRDAAAHPTVLSGIAGSTAVLATSDNSTATDARVDGFSISTAATGIALGQNSSLTVANCSFSGLETGISGTSDTLNVENCRFAGATQYGIYNVSGTLSVTDSVFTGNKIGVAQVNGSLSAVRSIFRGNGAPDTNGGGIVTNLAAASIESSLFHGNYSQRGAGLYSTGGTVAVRNSTFAGNYAVNGPAGISFSRFNNTGVLEIYNSILWGNAIPSGTGVSAQIFYGSMNFNPQVLFLANNNVQGAANNTDFNGNGNISVDPLFVSPVAASAAATTAGDYRLSPSSPLVNKGSNARLGSSTTDLAKLSRTFDNTVDLGAYELQVVQIAFVSPPADGTAGLGRPAVFSATANYADAAFQWQTSLDGGNTWTDLVESSSVSGVATSTLTVASDAAYAGRLFRVHVSTPAAGELFSSPVVYSYITVVVTPPAGIRDATLIGANATISFNVAGGALPASITDGSLTVHAQQTGRLSLADGSLTGLTINGTLVSMQSAVPFKPGELVEVTTTSAVQRADNFYANPMVYQFRAGNSGGYGAFLNAAGISGAQATARALGGGDLDGDGSVDLVIGGTNGATVWLNDGAGSFTSTGQTLGNGTVSQVLLGSLGLTGSTGSTNLLDVILRKSNGDVEIWRNEGDGSFTKTSTISGVGATALGLADLNGDGALDLFIATAGADQVWFNSGAGVFTDSAQRLGSGEGLSVAFGDFNRDNSLDVATANGSGNIELWSNDGAGNFSGSTVSSSPASVVITSDLDRDGKVDLVTISNISRIKVYKQFGSSLTYSFPSVPTISVGDAGALSVADVDGDGFPDIVTPSSSGTAQIWRGQGYDGSLGWMNFQQVTEQPAFPVTKAACPADFDGDGAIDLVTIAAAGAPTIARYVTTPTPPTGLTATAISDTRIALSWADNATSETNYTVERSANGTSGWSVLDSALAENSTTFTDAGCLPATRYYYRVRADVSGVLLSSYSNTANATTAAAIGAIADAIAVLEGATATALVGGATSVLTNDGNPDGGTLEATIVTPPAHGNLTLSIDGTFSYIPTGAFSGSDSFTYRATNTVTGAAADGAVSIVVTRLNDAPTSLTLTPSAGTIYTGQAAGITVGTLSAGDPDPEDAGQLTFSLVSGAGSSGNADFTITGTTLKTAGVIDASAGLARSLRIRATDSMGLFREESFTVNFTRPPSAAPASFNGDEDTPFQGQLQGTGGASALNYEAVSQPGHGTLTLNSDGTYTYTPNANFNGTDSFTYRILDGTLSSANVTVTFNVASVDDAPTIDAIDPVSTAEGTPVSFTLLGRDAEGDAITYQLASTPALGSVQLQGANVTYTPNSNVIGTETLSFTATANGLTSAPRSVVVNIVSELVSSTVYRGLYEYTDIPARAGDWSGVLPAAISTPAHGTVTLEGSRLLYQHNGDAATSDSFTYTLTNGAGDIRHVAVQLAIRDRVLDVTNSADSGPGTLRAAIDLANRFSDATLAPDHLASPDWLVRILPAAGTFTRLTSATDWGAALGRYSFLNIASTVTLDASAVPGYVLTTGGSHFARHFLVLPGASLTLKHVKLINGAAVDRTFVGADAAPIPFGGAILNFGTLAAENTEFGFNRAGQGGAIYSSEGTVSLTDSLFDGNSIVWASDPGGIVFSRNGSVSLTRVTFTNNSGQDGGDLSVTGDAALATVNVTGSTITSFKLATLNAGTLAVTGLPYARPDLITRPAGQPVTIALATLLANDAGAPFASVAADAASAAGVTISRSGDDLIYAAPANLTADDTFNYTITDAAGLTSVGTVTVSLAKDPYPRGAADAATVYRGLYEDVDVLANDSDDNGGTLVISSVSTPAHGTASIESGRIRYVHNGGNSTSDAFTYSVSNGTNITANLTVTLAIADRVLDATDGADSGPGTLRAALGIVNRFTGADTPPWTVRILAGTDQTWTPTGTTDDGYPDYRSAFKIEGNVLIDATGSPNFTLAGAGSPYGRLFLVTSGGRLALRGITLANSQAVADPLNPNVASYGGAVLNRGTFSSTNVDFLNNTATQGAALYNDGGIVTLADSNFLNNVANYSPFGSDNRGVVASVNGTINLVGGVSIDASGPVAALYVQGGTLNHSGTNHIASYQSFGAVTVVPGAPSAADDTVNCIQGRLLRIPLGTLFANDTNHSGAALSFSSNSTYGVPITRRGEFLLYNTAPGQTSDDSFTYTLTDAIGIASTATVNVVKFEAPPIVTVAPRPAGGAFVSLKGGANTPYRIYASSDLLNWSMVFIEEPGFVNDFVGVTDISTDGSGNAYFEDPAPLGAGNTRFYRAQSIYDPSVPSDPAGLCSIDCLSNSDTFTGIPFTRTPEFDGTIDSVTGNTITLEGSPGFAMNQFVPEAGTQPKTYYVHIGANAPTNPKEGQIYTVTANDAGSITVDPRGDDLSEITPGTRISIIPYWTLATLFPPADANATFTPSPSAFSLKTQVLVPDDEAVGINLAPKAIYYFLSSGGNVGWRKLGDPITADHGHEIIHPGSYLVIRNGNGAPQRSVVLAGSVAIPKTTLPLFTSAGSPQDNAVSLPQPMDATLDTLGLSPAAGNFVASTNGFSLQDQVLVFDRSATGINRAPSAMYFYLSSGANVGWRKVGDALTTDHGSDVIPAGSAIIIRKAKTAAGVTDFWTTSPNH